MLGWIELHSHEKLSLHDIAAHAATSIRTLNRRFQAETGQTPTQWLIGVRIRHAQELLERTSDGVETIGYRVGFESAANFREQFKRFSGVSPQAYRATFRDRGVGYPPAERDLRGFTRPTAQTAAATIRHVAGTPA